MTKKFSASDALAAVDWAKIDATTDADIARQIGENPDAAPDMAPAVDVRAIRRRTGMTQEQFAAAFEFSVRTVQEWERGAKRPSGPARTLLGLIERNPGMVQHELATRALERVQAASGSDRARLARKALHAFASSYATTERKLLEQFAAPT